MNKIIKRTILSNDNCIIWTRSENEIGYIDAVNYMDKIVQSIIDNQSKSVIWFLEHPAIYTVGSSSNLEDLLDPKTFPVYKTSRGGQITYHGPGQRIIYTILDLKKIFYPQKPDLAKYVRLLETTIIDYLFSIGIIAQRLEGSPGVWVKDDKGVLNKIASIGIRVKKWVCFHGMSINISTNLEHFKGIIPCGISQHGVTSLDKLGRQILVSDFDSDFGKILESNLKNANIT